MTLLTIFTTLNSFLTLLSMHEIDTYVFGQHDRGKTPMGKTSFE